MTSNLFISEDETVEVKINIAADDGKLTCWSDDEVPDGIKDFETYSAKFRRPNYRDTTRLMDAALQVGSNGEFAMSVSEVRYRRIVQLLVEWDFKDSAGKVMPATEASVNTLNPQVALALADGLETALGLFQGLTDDVLEEAEAMKAQIDQPQTEQQLKPSE